MRPRSKRAPRKIAEPAAKQSRGRGEARRRKTIEPPIAPAVCPPALNRPASIGARRCAFPNALNRRRAVSRRDDSPRRLGAPLSAPGFQERFGPSESKRGASAAVGRKRSGCSRSRFFLPLKSFRRILRRAAAPRAVSKSRPACGLGWGLGLRLGFVGAGLRRLAGGFDRGNRHGLGLGLGRGVGGGGGDGLGRAGPNGRDRGWGQCLGWWGEPD